MLQCGLDYRNLNTRGYYGSLDAINSGDAVVQTTVI